MIPVKAPDGIEAVRYFDDTAHEWRVSARRAGSLWYRNLGLIGHAHLTPEELDNRAAARVVCERLGFETSERYAAKAVQP